MAPMICSRKLERVLERARAQLNTRSYQTDEEDDHEYEGILIDHNMSLEKARRFMEQKHNVILRYIDGDLIAVDLTRLSQSRVGGELISFFISLDRHAVHSGSNEDMFIQGDLWEPDYGVAPRSSLSSSPTVIVEVADSEALMSVYRCATTYLDATTSVQVVICVKLWGFRRDGSRALLFMLFEQNNMVSVGGFRTPTRLVSFGNARLHPSVTNALVAWGVTPATIRGNVSQGGDAPCTAPNQQVYQIAIDAAVVLHGSTIAIPPTVANGYNIDLYDVQNIALLL